MIFNISVKILRGSVELGLLNLIRQFRRKNTFIDAAISILLQMDIKKGNGIGHLFS